MLRVGADALLALGAVRTTRPGTTRPPARTVCTRIHFPGSDPRGWPLGLAQNSCLIQMVLGIPVPAEPAILTTIRAANELLDLPPLHPPLIGACDRILTTLHGLLREADGIRAALELDEQLPLLRLIEEKPKRCWSWSRSRAAFSHGLVPSETCWPTSRTPAQLSLQQPEGPRVARYGCAASSQACFVC